MDAAMLDPTEISFAEPLPRLLLYQSDQENNKKRRNIRTLMDYLIIGQYLALHLVPFHD